MENNEKVKFTGRKIDRFKAMLSIGIITSAMMLTPGLINDAHAAGKAHNTSVEQIYSNSTRVSTAGKMQNVYKPSKKDLKRIQKAANNFEKQRQELGIQDNMNSDFTPSGNAFRDSLNIHNKKSPYYQGEVSSNSNISNSRIRGNVSIGKTTNGRTESGYERW